MSSNADSGVATSGVVAAPADAGSGVVTSEDHEVEIMSAVLVDMVESAGLHLGRLRDRARDCAKAASSLGRVAQERDIGLPRLQKATEAAEKLEELVREAAAQLRELDAAAHSCHSAAEREWWGRAEAKARAARARSRSPRGRRAAPGAPP